MISHLFFKVERTPALIYLAIGILCIGMSGCSEAPLRKEIAEQDHKIQNQEYQIASQEHKIANQEMQIADKQSQIKDKQTQLRDKQNQIVHENRANNALTSENRNLESEQSINKLFEDAQRVFSKNEAEVYQQNGTLTIRLRGLKFPTSKAILNDKNFPLLGKVQRVIKGFGKSSVLVEGYTDSIGNKNKNIKLSLNRAQAVREYLISNNEIKATDITAVGFGYEQPLASNKTIGGRAQNRRVDILIKPEKT